VVESGNKTKTTNKLERTNTMNDRKTSEAGMLGRSHQFALDHPLIPANAQATLLIAQIGNAKDAMLSAGGLQTQATGEFRMAVSSRQEIVKDLKAKMREIGVTAKALHRSGVQPGLDQQFRLTTRNLAELRSRAQAFKDALEPVKQVFIDYGSDATVVEDLDAAIAAFDLATGGRHTGLGRQINATAGLTAKAKAGILAVRALDAILIKKYRDNPALLAEWKAASRIADWPSQPSAAPTAAPEAAGSGSGSGSGSEAPAASGS
jgi:hypothetical protein